MIKGPVASTARASQVGPGLYTLCLPSCFLRSSKVHVLNVNLTVDDLKMTLPIGVDPFHFGSIFDPNIQKLKKVKSFSEVL